MRLGGCFLGRTIQDAISEAIRQATSHTFASLDKYPEVEFDFNGVEVRVKYDSDPELVYRDWKRGMSGYLGESPVVGPYPRPELSDEERASDARIEARNEQELQKRQEKYEEQERQKKATLQGALSVATPFDVVDQEGWDKARAANSDPYGCRVIRYAEEWARLMQTRIANGETVAECADELSRLADDDGITGFMYGAAVSVLSQVWRHGDELRRWRNKDIAPGDEGDRANESGCTLNPACLVVNPK